MQHLTAYKALIHTLTHFHLTNGFWECSDYCVHLTHEKCLHRGMRDLSAGLLIMLRVGRIGFKFRTCSLKFNQSHFYSTTMPNIKNSHWCSRDSNTIRDTVSRQTLNLICGLQIKQVKFFIIMQDKNSGVVPKQNMIHFQMNEEEILTDLTYSIVSVLNSIKHKRKRYVILLQLLSFCTSYKIQLWILERLK